MKPEEYNPKAREAFAHSLIDLGVAMFKSTMLLFTAVPITLIFKNAMKDGATQISIADAIGGMSGETYFVFLALLSAAFIGGFFFAKRVFVTFMRSKVQHNRSLQLTAQSAGALWVPYALRAPAATELRRWVAGRNYELAARSSNYTPRKQKPDPSIWGRALHRAPRKHPKGFGRRRLLAGI